MLIESSMEKYSQLLGWGISGAQPECWVMLDMAVRRCAAVDRAIRDIEKLDRTHRGDMAVIGKILAKEMGLL